MFSRVSSSLAVRLLLEEVQNVQIVRPLAFGRFVELSAHRLAFGSNNDFGFCYYFGAFQNWAVASGRQKPTI